MDATLKQKEWCDGKLLIEELLATMIAQLEIASEVITAEQLFYQEQFMERQWIEKVETDYLQTKKAELIKFKLLLSKAERCRQAMNLRAYINTVEANANRNNLLTDDLTGWLEWAKKKADWYDPMIKSFDVLLGEINRDQVN